MGLMKSIIEVMKFGKLKGRQVLHLSHLIIFDDNPWLTMYFPSTKHHQDLAPRPGV